MSVLADLLSKTQKTDPLGGKGVPPTLARAQRNGAPPSNQKKRFITMSVVALAAILAGLFLPTQIKRLSSLLSAKTAATAPQPVKMPLPSKASPADAPATIAENAQKPAVAVEPATISPPIQPAVKSAASQQPSNGKKIAPRPPAKSAVALQRGMVQDREKLIVAKPAPAAKKGTETLNRTDTDARSAMLYAARSAEQAGDWRGALASYRSALEIDPDNYRIMSNSAAAYNKLGMYADGEREARRALARKPDYVPALINTAIACSSQGNDKEAIRFFNAASAADPGNKSLALNLGIMQERSGDLDEALKTYRRGAAAGDPQALYGVGRIHEQKGNKGEAINAYRAIMLLKNVDLSLKREAKDRLVRLEE